MTTNRVMAPSTASSTTTSAVSRPVGGRDSGEFSILMASAGRLGTEPPEGATPVSGQTAGTAAPDVGFAAAELLVAVFWEHPAMTSAVAAAAAARRAHVPPRQRLMRSPASACWAQ